MISSPGVRRFHTRRALDVFRQFREQLLEGDSDRVRSEPVVASTMRGKVGPSTLRALRERINGMEQDYAASGSGPFHENVEIEAGFLLEGRNVEEFLQAMNARVRDFDAIWRSGYSGNQLGQALYGLAAGVVVPAASLAQITSGDPSPIWLGTLLAGAASGLPTLQSALGGSTSVYDEISRDIRVVMDGVFGTSDWIYDSYNVELARPTLESALKFGDGVPDSVMAAQFRQETRGVLGRLGDLLRALPMSRHDKQWLLERSWVRIDRLFRYDEATGKLRLAVFVRTSLQKPQVQRRARSGALQREREAVPALVTVPVPVPRRR